MDRRRLWGLAVAPTLFLAGACGSEAAEAPPLEEVDETVASWACIQAIAATGLSTGSTIEQARENLEALRSSSSSTVAEANFYGELMSALDGRDGTDVVDDALDSVPCSLP